jgi:hypothetical protein
MTAKKTVRKPKTFWAVRIAKAEDETGEMNVSLFPKRPRMLDLLWGEGPEWVSLGDSDGGQICYAHFLRITGIALKVGEPVEIAITARRV